MKNKQSIENLMMIDDDEVFLMISDIIIKKSGVVNQIIPVQSALSAIDYLKNNENDWPQVIFCDINMPLMNGWQFIEKLNEYFSQIHLRTMLCMLTSSSNSADKKRAKAMKSISMFLTKPLDEHKFKRVYQYYNLVY